MIDFIKNVDFLSLRPSILINSKHRYKNFFGGIISLLYFLSIAIIFQLLIIKFFNKDNLIAIFNEEILLNPEYKINNNPFFFQVYDQSGNNIKDADRIFKLSAFVYKTEISYVEGIPLRKMKVIDLPLKNCSHVIDNYSEYRQLIESNYYQDKMCIDPNSNFTLKGMAGDGNNSTFFYLNVEKCNNSTVINSKECFPESYINSILIKPMLAIRYIDYTINNNDINNPYTPFIRGDIIFFSANMIKIVNYLFCNAEYKNDYGLIYDEYTSNYFTIYDEKYIDISILPNSADLILRLNFTLSKKKKIIIRTFQKIQSLIANISGIFNILYLFLEIACNLFIQPYYFYFIGKSLNIFEYTLDNQQKFEKKNKILMYHDSGKVNMNPKSLNKVKKKSNHNNKNLISDCDVRRKKINNQNIIHHSNFIKTDSIKNFSSKYFINDNFEENQPRNIDEISKNIKEIKCPNTEIDQINYNKSNKLKKKSDPISLNLDSQVEIKQIGGKFCSIINERDQNDKIIKYTINSNLHINKSSHNNFNNYNRSYLKNAKEKISKKNIIFSFYELLCGSIFYNRKYFKSNLMIIYEKYLKRKISMENILRKLVEFDKLRFFLLKYNELKELHNIPGPNIFQLDQINNKISNVYNESKTNLNLLTNDEDEFNIFNFWKNFEFDQ